MTVLAKVELPVDPAKVNEMTSFLAEILPDTRTFDGCQGIDAYQGQDDTSRVVLVERWDSRDHHQKYLGWREETGVLGTLVGMCQGAPDIQYFDQIKA